MSDSNDLRNILRRIDGRGYKAYKNIQDSYLFTDFVLHIDHVQGDPFAAPSKIRVRMDQSVCQFPGELFANRIRRVAFQDFLARQVARAIREIGTGRRGSGKSGLITVDAGGQEVLERTAVLVTPNWTEVRMQVGLPAAGRTILGRQAEEMLCRDLPRIAAQALVWKNLPKEQARQFVECVENQEAAREQLKERGLVAFVANGSILPRQSGASDLPMDREQAVRFRAPESLQVTLPVPNPIPTASGRVSQLTGLGIPRGITLIVGGGYHGKSTLLEALERGVYPHIPGDGREYVITCREAVKIRAEDGRRVAQVDVSPFISRLPRGRSTGDFSSEDASGSTSQAANIVEALEVGATLLLLDEDTSATNFMIRDARMQALVHKENEPITPFLDRVRELFENFDISTILVMGGSGDYFDVADTVIMMREFLPLDVTRRAKQIAAEFQTQRKKETPSPFKTVTPRIPLVQSFDPSRGRREVKIDARGIDTLLFGSETVDLRAVEQLVDVSQTRAVGYAIYLAARRFMNNKLTLREILDALEAFLSREGLDALDPYRRGQSHPGNFALPRRFEIAAAINRLRTVRMRQVKGKE